MYEIKIDYGKTYGELMAMEEWCTSNFGLGAHEIKNLSPEHPWSIIYNMGKFSFYFLNKEYAVLFKLRSL